MSEDYEYPEHYNEEEKLRSKWWVDELERIKEVRDQLISEVVRRDDVELDQSHHATDSDGEHGLSFTLKVRRKSVDEVLDNKTGPQGEIQ